MKSHSSTISVPRRRSRSDDLNHRCPERQERTQKGLFSSRFESPYLRRRAESVQVFAKPSISSELWAWSPEPRRRTSCKPYVRLVVSVSINHLPPSLQDSNPNRWTCDPGESKEAAWTSSVLNAGVFRRSWKRVYSTKKSQKRAWLHSESAKISSR
jgi:hypothetical protein